MSVYAVFLRLHQFVSENKGITMLIGQLAGSEDSVQVIRLIGKVIRVRILLMGCHADEFLAEAAVHVIIQLLGGNGIDGRQGAQLFKYRPVAA